MVEFTDAATNPKTMMVVLPDAFVAILTVLRSKGQRSNFANLAASISGKLNIFEVESGGSRSLRLVFALLLTVSNLVATILHLDGLATLLVNLHSLMTFPSLHIVNLILLRIILLFTKNKARVVPSCEKEDY